MNPFREPSENEEDFEELVRRDRDEYLAQEKAFPIIKCQCGARYTLETHTVCPKCFRFPAAKDFVTIARLRGVLSKIQELSTGWAHGTEGVCLLRINELAMAELEGD